MTRGQLRLRKKNSHEKENIAPAANVRLAQRSKKMHLYASSLAKDMRPDDTKSPGVDVLYRKSSVSVGTFSYTPTLGPIHGLEFDLAVHLPAVPLVYSLADSRAKELTESPLAEVTEAFSEIVEPAVGVYEVKPLHP
ncbi:hypothetical protein HYDPIDRAFT_37300 [Hydnomerulius pinastri MD-312]|nr:hypothetical protein HYDPIDRAFT_37300 [Hydnomerulius pinastri MD-312]